MGLRFMAVHAAAAADSGPGVVLPGPLGNEGENGVRDGEPRVERGEVSTVDVIARYVRALGGQAPDSDCRSSAVASGVGSTATWVWCKVGVSAWSAMARASSS